MSRWDRPAVPGVLLLALGLAYVGVHLVVFAHGDLTRFVVAGSHHAIDPPRGLHVTQGAGFDGQFEYRLALAPWDLTGRRSGIVLDFPYRAQRITYPALAWLFSGFGRPSAVPAALIGVNLGAYGLIGTWGGRLARGYGRHALWGALIGVYFGFVWSFGRDLTELVEVASLLAGIVGIHERRVGWASAGLVAAVLSRETSLIVLAAYGAWQLPRILRARRLSGDDLPWITGFAAFLLWQGYGRWRLGQVPLLSDRANAGRPFRDLADSFRLWLHQAGHGIFALSWVTEILTMALLVAVALWLAPWRDREGYLTAGTLALAVLGASLSRLVWADPADLRVLASLYALCVVCLLRSSRPAADIALRVLTALMVMQVGLAVWHRVPIE